MKVNKRSNDFTNFNIGATQEAQENASAIEEATSNKEIVQIPIEDIEFNPNNTRFRDIDTDESITELAKSIDDYGVLVPISVYKHGNKYMLISGERRTRACMKLNLRTIDAIIYEDLGDLENTVRLYEANLQTRELDIRTRFFAVKDILEKYKNSGMKTEELARKANVAKSTFLKYKKMLMDAEDGDIALFRSKDITWQEFVKHTQNVIAERERYAFEKRISIISDYTEDVHATNYIDPHTNTVYSVEREEDGKYCTVFTKANIFKVPMHHYQDQGFDTFEKAQIALTMFATSNNFSIYHGDFSEFKKQETPSPSPAVVETASDSATNAEQESETSAINEKDYGPSLIDTVPTQEVGGDTPESSTEDSSEKTSVDDVPVDDSESDSTTNFEEEHTSSDDEKTDSAPAAKKEQEKVRSSTDSEEVEDPQKKSVNTDSDYLNQYANFSGYCPVNATTYYGALVYSGTRTFIITQLQVDSGTPVDKVMKKTTALFVEVDPTSIQRYEL